MWTKFTAAIESKTLPDIAELDAVGPARLANLGRARRRVGRGAAATKESGRSSNGRRGGEVRRQVLRGAPLCDSLVLFYRPDLLAKVGAGAADT